MLKKEDVKNDVDYWFSSAYFKHSSGQFSKTHRVIKPRKVKIEFRNNDVYLSDSVTNQRINHPLYYCFQSYNTVTDNYFGNFVFETEKEAWDNFYYQINKEIERIDDIYEKKRSLYTSFLIK